MLNETTINTEETSQARTAVKPTVAIVGRQNVGKSTLLNRLAGKPISIVEDLPGTTRDRVFADMSWRGLEFTLVDTGGLEIEPSTAISVKVRDQVHIALAEASVIVFVVNAREGVIPADLEIASMLRKANKPMLLLVNKVDNAKLEAEVVEFTELGLGDPIPVSAYHGRGTSELLDKIVALLPAQPPAAAEAPGMKLAIVGRPGVGKSMLLNKMVGSQRAIVGDIPGTTRDATDTRLDFDGHSMLLIDTAGIRRRGRIVRGIERYSVARSLRAVDRADVALLILDATELVTAQDTHVAGYIQQAAKGIVIVVNKWDLVEGQQKSDWSKQILNEFKFMSYAPVLFTSAVTGEGLDKVIPAAFEVYQERHKRLSTSQVNNVVRQAAAIHGPPRKGTKRLKVLYATQAEVNPPTFVFFVNDAKLMHFSYQRYLENKLRQAFGFKGTPLRMVFKTRGEQQ